MSINEANESLSFCIVDDAKRQQTRKRKKNVSKIYDIEFETFLDTGIGTTGSNRIGETLLAEYTMYDIRWLPWRQRSFAIYLLSS